MYYSKLGTEIWLTKPLTMRDFNEICKSVNLEISEYDVTSNEFPEGNYDMRFNGRGYKLARFERHNQYDSSLNTYKDTESGTLKKLEGLNRIWVGRDRFRNKRRKYINEISMRLKKSNAPDWTKEELDTIVAAFEDRGCKVVKLAKLE